MGFLSRENVQKIIGEEYQKEMEEWAKKYPFAVYMLFSKDTDEQKLAHAESLYLKQKKEG